MFYQDEISAQNDTTEYYDPESQVINKYKG
jgi:hypothetical protein